MEKDNYFLTRIKTVYKDQSKVINNIKTTDPVKCRIRDNFNNVTVIDWLELTPIEEHIEIPSTVIAQLVPTQYEVEIYNKDFNLKVVLNVKP